MKLASKVHSFLGTDIGASGLIGMADQICMAERVSKCRAINSDQDRCHVTFRKAYEWATLGGARGMFVSKSHFHAV